MVEIVCTLLVVLGVVAVVQTIVKAVVSWRLAKLAIEAEDRRKRDGILEWRDVPQAEVMREWPHDRRH
jgi:hypothetical protein